MRCLFYCKERSKDLTVKDLKKELNKFNDEAEIHLVDWTNGIVQDFYGIETDDLDDEDKDLYISYNS